MAYPSNQWTSRSSSQCLWTGLCLPGSPKCWGDPYITRDMGTMGVPISQGSQYHAYSGSVHFCFRLARHRLEAVTHWLQRHSHEPVRHYTPIGGFSSQEREKSELISVFNWKLLVFSDVSLVSILNIFVWLKLYVISLACLGRGDWCLCCMAHSRVVTFCYTIVHLRAPACRKHCKRSSGNCGKF